MSDGKVRAAGSTAQLAMKENFEMREIKELQKKRGMRSAECGLTERWRWLGLTRRLVGACE